MAAAVVLGGMALGATAVLLQAAGVCLAILPLATGAAILRYRLYDLDHIISRTLAYGLLTVLLGGGYAAIVLGLGQLLGRRSTLAVAVATLAVAVATLAVAGASQPARRRVQQIVDRRCDDRTHTIQWVQCPAAPADRPGHPDRRATGGGRADHAADHRVAVASTFPQGVPGPAHDGRLPRGPVADASVLGRSHGCTAQHPGASDVIRPPACWCARLLAPPSRRMAEHHGPSY